MYLRLNPNRRRSGIALVIVMVVVLVLGVVAGGFAYTMRVEMRLARHASHDEDLEWMGRSGVELAKFIIGQKELIQQEAAHEALNQQWAGGIGTSNSPLSGFSLTDLEIGKGTVSVRITDTERKFNINLMDQTLLQQALILMGVDAGDFPTIVDSIQDWIDRDDNSRLSGAETDYYMNLTPPYVAKNGLIDDITELLLIQGITPEMFWGPAISGIAPSNYQPGQSRRRPFNNDEAAYPVGLRDLFTPISAGRLNINTASATMLQVIPEVDANTAMAIVQWRAGPDGVEGTEDDTPFRNVGELNNVGAFTPQMIASMGRYLDVRSHTFEVEVEAKIDETTRRFDAVIRRAANAVDFVVVQFSWR